MGRTEPVQTVASSETALTDPTLAEIIAAWPELSLAMQSGIAAMVRVGRAETKPK